jgi:hypothetical protein
MGHEKTIVDASTPEAIAVAIKKVNSTPSLRIRTGAEALWKIFNAPNHSLPRRELEKQFGALDLHFGWFCRRVAEELGANSPDAFALVDYDENEDDGRLLSLKPSVAAAIREAKMPRNSS